MFAAQARIQEALLVESLPRWWHKALYQQFLAMQSMPPAEKETSAALSVWRSRVLGLATVLFLLAATLYVISFHFMQQTGDETALQLNLSIYGSTLRDVGTDLLIVTPMVLLFTKSLIPAFVARLLASHLDTHEARLGGRSGGVHRVLTGVNHAKGKFCEMLHRSREAQRQQLEQQQAAQQKVLAQQGVIALPSSAPREIELAPRRVTMRGDTTDDDPRAKSDAAEEDEDAAFRWQTTQIPELSADTADPEYALEILRPSAVAKGGSGGNGGGSKQKMIFFEVRKLLCAA